jgi:biofilm PGA synthesis N-glycosyltransferase PgaC
MEERAPKRRFRERFRHWTVGDKFILAVVLAFAWMAFSTWAALPWIRDLGAIVTIPFAILIVSTIALLPGFMNMFLAVALISDRRPPRTAPAEYPGVTILVAAYNEAADIGDTVSRILEQDYRGPFEVIVIDDGSSDYTRGVLAFLEDGAKVRVLSPPHGGKAKALGAGLEASCHELVVSIDADTMLHPTALTCLVERLLSDPPNTVAVAGALLVNNAQRNIVTRVQEFDYLLGIATVKRAQSLFQGTLVAQGAFSIYRKAALREIGAWPSMVGEDIVMTWALLSRGWRVGYAEDAIAFTNVPETYSRFFSQRKRWARGLIEAFKAHPRVLVQMRLTTLFIYWNLLFPLLDTVFVTVFIPGLVLAFFGRFYIAGPMTLAVIPLGMLNTYVMYAVQKKMLDAKGIRLRENHVGFLAYVLGYAIAMQPACVSGYVAEIANLGKSWGTK